MLTATTRVLDVLCRAAEMLRKAPLPAELADRMEQLARDLDQPCVLAIVGRAKAGKSTFVNALLGADLAKVGVTETTATINFFRYGKPANPDRPIRCYWRSGHFEDVDQAFYESLQGNDCETLQRAAAIERLEFYLSHEVLREVTIVDTPGTEAVLDEHQQATAEFLKLRNQLREQHNLETHRWTTQADAVIYLISQVPRVTDKALLEEFQQVTGGRARALNAVGVIAKVDLYPEIRSKVGTIAEQLKDCLNTVVPVSAALQRALDQFTENNAASLGEMFSVIRLIPKARLSKLLDSDELWDEYDFEDCPVSAKDRRKIRGDIPWSVFTTIVKNLPREGTTLEHALCALKELAGFETLKEVLQHHFYRRAKLLRAFRILNAARDVLDEIRFRHLPTLERRDDENRKRRDRFIGFIRSSSGDQEVAQELEGFIEAHLDSSASEAVTRLCGELGMDIAKAYHELKGYNADFEALTNLERDAALFTEVEHAELRALFGLYGFEFETRLNGRVDPSYVSERQAFWSHHALIARQEARRKIAEHAAEAYGRILNELLD